MSISNDFLYKNDHLINFCRTLRTEKNMFSLNAVVNSPYKGRFRIMSIIIKTTECAYIKLTKTNVLSIILNNNYAYIQFQVENI